MQLTAKYAEEFEGFSTGIWAILEALLDGLSEAVMGRIWVSLGRRAILRVRRGCKRPAEW